MLRTLKSRPKTYKTIKIDYESYYYLKKAEGDISMAQIFRKIFPLSKKRVMNMVNNSIDEIEYIAKVNLRNEYNESLLNILNEVYRSGLTLIFNSKDPKKLTEMLLNYVEQLNNEATKGGK